MFTFGIIPELASLMFVEYVAFTWRFVPETIGDLILDGINQADDIEYVTDVR